MRCIEQAAGSGVLHGCLYTPSLELPQAMIRPAVLVLPGGNYEYCAERDGETTAARFLSLAFHAFHLTYACNQDQALADAEAALSLLWENAADWGVDVHQIVLVGVDTGAHLALRLAMRTARKPSAVVLLDSSFAPGVPEIDVDCPPLFLAGEMTGGHVALAAALEKQGVPCELHLTARNGRNAMQEAAAFVRSVWSGETAGPQPIVCTADTPLNQLMTDRRRAAVFYRYFARLRPMLKANTALAGLSPRQIAGYAKGAIPDSALAQMEKELAELVRPKQKAFSPQNCIRPGKVWRDTQGKRIQAHGGAVWYENGTYYWYGENKELTDGKNGVWTSGIRCYTSKDLYNWEDQGLIIPPSDNPASNLHNTKRVDRPHIIKARSGRYVCWIKLSGAEACFVILSAENILGPWQVEKESYSPLGMKVGDFDIIRDETSGKHFLYMDADHAAIVCFELSEDGLAVRQEVSRSYEGLHPPFCREGVSLFEHNGMKYMLSSGMTGYIPNQSDCAQAACWTDEFLPIGNPHVDDPTLSSFNSQISKIFRVEGKNHLFIAMADRWVPDYPVDARRAMSIRNAIASRYDPDHYPATDADRSEVANSPMLTSANTSIADYVWLPIEMIEGKPRIKWYDTWRIEDFT